MSAPAREMHLAVRADASHDIGYGHIRRTLAVVDRLRAHTNLRVKYLMHPASDGAPASAAGCEVARLPDAARRRSPPRCTRSAARCSSTRTA
ncbi:MAG TPA: hypothetical protein PLQ87_03675 [Phycisphaerae bacterium]|nr:hypothetical protein [Phycisphaerae bacterium]